MNIPKDQMKFVYGLIIMIIIGMCASCAQEVNYYPNVSKPSPHAKKMTKKEKQCAGEWYANRYKRTGR